MSAAWFPGVGVKRMGGLPVPHFMLSQRILGSVGIVHFSMGAGGYCFLCFIVFMFIACRYVFVYYLYYFPSVIKVDVF